MATEYTVQTLGDALEEPVLTIGSLRYRGRILSIEEWLPFYERQVAIEGELEKAKEQHAAPNLRSSVALWVDYLRVVFPRRRYRWWAPDPIAQIRKQPGPALREAFFHFFSHQARALGWQLASLTTDGTSSSEPTPAAAAVAAE